MADKKIGELPMAQALEDDSLLAVYQGNETRSIKGELIARFAREAAEGFVGQAAESAKQAAASRDAAAQSAADAEKSRDEAGQSAETADRSRQAIESMTVSAATLGTGAEATVTKSADEGVVHLRFGLPRGEPGEKSACIDLVLTADGWVGNRQSAGDAKLVAAGYNYLVGGAPGRDNLAAYHAADIQAEDMTEDGKMWFTCGETPKSDLTVRVYRFAATEEA